MGEMEERFVEEIKLRGYDDKYIDKNEEREILQIAIHQGVGLDAARTSLAQACDRLGYVLESRLVQIIKDLVGTVVAKDGKIDREDFERIFQNIRQQTADRRNARELKRLVIVVMEDAGLNQIKSGWFRNWYSAVKREVGLV